MTNNERTRSLERATQDEVAAMPALLTTEDLARIAGLSIVYVTRQCKHGMFKDCSVKLGKSWGINKAKALEILGLA